MFGGCWLKVIVIHFILVLVVAYILATKANNTVTYPCSYNVNFKSGCNSTCFVGNGCFWFTDTAHTTTNCGTDSDDRCSGSFLLIFFYRFIATFFYSGVFYYPFCCIKWFKMKFCDDYLTKSEEERLLN